MPAFEVKSAPPMRAARVPAFAPRSWARRTPNSSRMLAAPAVLDEEALVAISIW